MGRRLLSVAAPVLILTLLSPGAPAQYTDDKGQLYFVIENKVRPSQVAQYEAAFKEFLANARAQNVLTPMMAIQGDDLAYSFIVRVQDRANPNPRFFDKLEAKMGPEAREITGAKFEGTLDWVRSYMLSGRFDLSYRPAADATTGETMPFVHFDYYNFEVRKMGEAIGIAREWAALLTGNRIEHGYQLFIGDTGTEGNMIVTAQFARSAAEFYAQQDRITAKLGEARVVAERDRLRAIMRKFDHRNGTVRQDLSYLPAKVLKPK